MNCILLNYKVVKLDQAIVSNELDGHGSEKTLSNLRPHDQEISTTPPPYRMPPYPVYNEPSIPGASMPLATSSPTIPQSLQTHSNKFPIEREVIITSGDKNSKIPILHDYMKKAKGAIAPDIPPKQTAAWTLGQISYTDATFPTATLQCMNISGSPLYRENAQSSFYTRDSHTHRPLNVSNQMMFRGTDPKTLPSESRADIECNNTKIQSQVHQLDNQRDETKLKNKNLTKTYHAIKDIISNKFKSIRENDKCEEDLNNTMDEVKQNAQDVFGIGNSKSNMITQQRYNQEVIQKHFMDQKILKSQANAQQFHSQQIFDRTQEIFTKYDAFPEDSIGSTPSKHTNLDIDGMTSHQLKMTENMECRIDEKNRCNDLGIFRGRRTLSQPQLMNTKCIIPDNLPQPQTTKFKRGSQINLSVIPNCDGDKEYNDGSFVKSCSTVLNSKDFKSSECVHNSKQGQIAYNFKTDSIVDTELQGFSRKKLECEIGNIQGVYSVGSRTNDISNSQSKKQSSPSVSSDYEKIDNADSGRGSAAYTNERRFVTHDMTDSEKSIVPGLQHTNIQQNETEWVDIVESELKNILSPRNQDVSENVTNSTISESISSMTPPLPPLSPGEQSSPIVSRRNSTRREHNSPQYVQRQTYGNSNVLDPVQTEVLNKWYINSNQKLKGTRKLVQNSGLVKQRQNFGLDTTDITSTTTRSVDLESTLDIHSESDGDLSSYGAQTIRKQLEGLEGMYTEVLKLLGVKKNALRYQPSDPRFSKRRYGSISSLQTSSVSSRPIRDKRRSHDDRKKVRDIKSINKRFQRLESHVVTLARSVAHLSSEMRTQHLMIQEMENIRSEISTLRTHTNMLNIRSQSTARTGTNLRQLPSLANPTRVKKLTNFFGDEPPLLRLFLRNMGYEKYASVFEKESIGMIELPYLSEERFQKLGIPLGPRLRIMEQAQISVFKDNTLCIV